jgi:excisionase family DNA binding protein
MSSTELQAAYTVRQLVEAGYASASTIRRAIRNGRLRCVRAGTRVLILSSDLRGWLCDRPGSDLAPDGPRALAERDAALPKAPAPTAA